MTPDYKTEEEMFPVIEQWESSGQSQSVFCEEHNIAYSLFGYWRTKYLRSKSLEGQGRFIELTTDEPENPYVEIFYPNGIKLCVASASTSYLKSLIHKD